MRKNAQQTFQLRFHLAARGLFSTPPENGASLGHKGVCADLEFHTASSIGTVTNGLALKLSFII